MKGLVVYDSQFGNTKKIAQAIGRGMGSQEQISVKKVDTVAAEDLADLDILIVGCPTQRLSATPIIKDWLESIPAGSLNGIQAAAFDTRFTEEKIAELSRVLSFFVKIFGYAAQPIARLLAQKGADIVHEPEGFYVADTEGPLLESELERAEVWGGKIRTER